MHAIIVMFAAVLLALWPARIGAQCDQCEGDFNGDRQVTINEIIVSVNSALNGCPTPGPRFVDNLDGTITDTKTRLQWEKKSDDGSIHDQDDTYTWSTGPPNHPDGTAFTSFLAALNSTSCFAGHCDWRLPNVAELQTIVDYGSVDPAIDAVFNTACTTGPSCTATACSCTVRDTYWSDTASVDLPDNAWAVEFNRGVVTLYDMTLDLHVRAVRGGS